MVNTYLATSKEFQGLSITKTVQGVTTTVTTSVQYVVVPKGTPLTSGTMKTPEMVGGEIGFFTDQLTPGYWDVGVRVTTNPEQPLLFCGTIRIK